MSFTDKIARNTLWHFSAKALGMFFGIVSVALVTRYLGQSGFGWYATVFAWLQFFAILIDFGLYLILLAELGRAENQKKEEKIIGNLLSLRLLSGITILLIANGIIWFLPYELPVKIGVGILAWAFLFQLLNQLLTGVFQKKLQMAKGSLVEIIGKAIGLFFTYLIVINNWGFYSLLAVISTANLINFLIMWLLLRRQIKLRLYWDFSYWRRLTSLAWPLAIGAIFNLFYFKADTLILSFFRSAAEVGIYAAPYRVLEVLISLPPIFLGLIMPWLAQNHAKKNYQRFKNIIQKSFDFFMIITLPLLSGTLLLAKPLMILVAGRDFATSGAVLQILILATVFIFFSQLFSYAIIALNQQKKTLKYIIAASLLAIIAYIIYIPRYSYLAAAVITALVEGVVMITFYFFISAKLHWRPNWRLTKKTALAALLMTLLILPLRHLPVLIVISLAALSYGILLFIMKIASLTDLKTLFKL